MSTKVSFAFALCFCIMLVTITSASPIIPFTSGAAVKDAGKYNLGDANTVAAATKSDFEQLLEGGGSRGLNRVGINPSSSASQNLLDSIDSMPGLIAEAKSSPPTSGATIDNGETLGDANPLASESELEEFSKFSVGSIGPVFQDVINAHDKKPGLIRESTDKTFIGNN